MFLMEVEHQAVTLPKTSAKGIVLLYSVTPTKIFSFFPDKYFCFLPFFQFSHILRGMCFKGVVLHISPQHRASFFNGFTENNHLQFFSILWPLSAKAPN